MEWSILWNLFQGGGSAAAIVAAIILVSLTRNDLKHLSEDVKWLKDKLVDHLENHPK